MRSKPGVLRRGSWERLGKCWRSSPLPGPAPTPGAGVLSLPVVQLLRGGWGKRAIWVEDPLCCLLACLGMHQRQRSWKPRRGRDPELGAQTREAEPVSLSPGEPRLDSDPRAWRTGRAEEQKAEPRSVDRPEHRASGAGTGQEGGEPGDG